MSLAALRMDDAEITDQRHIRPVGLVLQIHAGVFARPVDCARIDGYACHCYFPLWLNFNIDLLPQRSQRTQRKAEQNENSRKWNPTPDGRTLICYVPGGFFLPFSVTSVSS